MEALKGEIRDAMVGYMALTSTGQQKMAVKLNIQKAAISDFIGMKRLPRIQEVQKLDAFFKKGDRWNNSFNEATRAKRRRTDDRGGRIHRIRTANGREYATSLKLGQYAKLDAT